MFAMSLKKRRAATQLITFNTIVSVGSLRSVEVSEGLSTEEPVGPSLVTRKIYKLRLRLYTRYGSHYIMHQCISLI